MFDVIHVLSSIAPNHGGPSRTVPALAAAQAALGARVALATLAPPDPPHHPSPFTLHPSRPSLLPASLACSADLAHFLRENPASAIHAHGLWQRPLHYAHVAALRHSAPLVIAPRGMLEPWALAHRTWKKRLAAALIHPGAVAAATGWHATSGQEAQSLRELPAWLRPARPEASACVAPNGIGLPSPADAAPARAAWLAAHPRLAATRVALFYGRLHRKKRVAELIDLWRAAAPPGWTLLVAGIPGDYTIAELRARAGEARIVVADGGAMPQPYALADLFLLPSHSENFGQAVAEALAAGVPALVTDTLPWRELDAAKAGRCVAWEDYPAALAALAALPREALAALGAQGRDWVLANFTWEASARRLLAFYPTLRPPAK